MSHAMLEDVAGLKAKYPQRVHFILGNHELAELTDYPIQKNKQMLNLLFRLGLQQMYGPAADKVRDAFREFLRSCPLALRLPCGVFITHTLPENVDTRVSTRASSSGNSTYTSSASGRRSSNSSGVATIARRTRRLCRVGRGQRADQRPRALSRGFSDAQLEADHSRLLRREGELSDRAQRRGADPRRSRQADSAAGVRRAMPTESSAKGAKIQPRAERTRRPGDTDPQT